MRNLNLLFSFTLLFTVTCIAQSASVSVKANAGLPLDDRPFGKYLVEICTLAGDSRTLNCIRMPDQPDPKKGWSPDSVTSTQQKRVDASRPKIDQTITLKLHCGPGPKDICKSETPPITPDTDFFVSATADSGRRVLQAIISGNVVRIGGNEIVHYKANGPGTIIIRATQAGDVTLEAATPVDLILPIANPQNASKPCSVLPPAPPANNAPLDATTIASLLGNPTPFILSAQGPNTIAIYTTRQPIYFDERKILASFQDEIAALAGYTAPSLGVTATGKPFTVELQIPHAAALGDLATRVNGLNYSAFTLQDVGSDKVRVTATSQPDCDTWTSFLSDIRHMAWQLVSDPMNQKLFYLSSTDVTAGFSGLAPAATPAASTSSSTPSSSSAASSSSASATNATISIAQPPGSNIQINSDTTPCVIAGLAFGTTTACASSAMPAATTTSASSPSSASAAAPAAKAPLGMASVAVAAGTGEQSPPDLLIFSDTNPGDDAQVEERRRILAQLDLPRPEMIINAWVTQNSSSNPQAMGAFTNLVNSIVADYNEQFENVVLRGWASVERQSALDSYWNEAFRSYIEDRYVADSSHEKPGNSIQEMSQAFLDNSQAKLAESINNRDEIKGPWLCSSNRYCLGYNSLFHPLKPGLTDLLITIIAAQDPVHVADVAIDHVEGLPQASAVTEAICDIGNAEIHRRCQAIWHNLDLDHVSTFPLKQLNQRSCADRDYRGTLYSLFQSAEHTPRIHLQCFKEELHRLLQSSDNGRTPFAGLLRSAIADFLFNYKLSQQYPHEFAAYDLTRSADALNSALTPLIDAFNRDITTYQLFVRADMQYQVDRLNARNDDRCCVKRLFGLDKPSFFNDGLVSVRTISGQATTVNTTTQSFLNVSTAPQLAALLSSVAGSGSSSSGSSGSTNNSANGTTPKTPVPTDGALGQISMIANLLSNYQTSTAQIGRGLNITATPRSLSTASSAEIYVALNADESAGPTLYSGTATAGPPLDISRVATHDTTTRVRIDSVKLFEISSLTAILQRSRSRFPLLPPFVEIPYIGTFAGVPLGAAKEFHNSTAVISAYVVPTATDIAYGLRFVQDLVVDGLNSDRCSFYKRAAGSDVANACLFRKALSFRDLGYRSLANFNKTMTRCLANDYASSDCQSITFDDVPSMNH
jgi:hypothetical protein